MKMKRVVIFIICLLVLTTIFVACDKSSTKSKVDLAKIYQTAGCENPWAKLANDSSYIAIDTNPYDYNSNDYPYMATMYFGAAENAIKSIHSSLGIPDSLYEQMLNTSASMGKQTKEFSSIDIEVSWSYHPSKGLEVMYSKIYN